ncbi:MAG: 3-deoxy-8-phosphooctulonate synthase [bacterium]|jgi:2-dehydro-3-deoxyphosphooctonate aldolase (KDO 8-P synthase)
MSETLITNHTITRLGFPIGWGHPLALIAGPCVIESRDLCFEVAGRMKEICGSLGVPYIFKASFDKANRTSVAGYRGVGMIDGLSVLSDIRRSLEVPVLTDVHEASQVSEVAPAVDILQIPAFLCRQTDLLLAVGASGQVVNVKKGQFLAPWDMAQVVAKIKSTGNEDVIVTERGSSFGYNRLVVDMRSLEIMRETGCPVCFDATHSVQEPGGKGSASGGDRRFVPGLSRAAAAVGVSALFWEVHPDPDNAMSDGPNMLRLEDVAEVLAGIVGIDRMVKGNAG